MLIGGEALPAELARALRRRRPAGSTNLYGPTETTIWSAAIALDGDELAMTAREPADWSSDLEHAGLCFGRWS